MQLNPLSSSFDRALVTVIGLISLLGVLTVVLPASSPPQSVSFRGDAAPSKPAAGAGAMGIAPPVIRASSQAHLARLMSIQVRHELERVGKLVEPMSNGARSAERRVYSNIAGNRSLRLLNGLVRRIAKGDSRFQIVDGFGRESRERTPADISNIADFMEVQEKRIAGWSRRLATWGGGEDYPDAYLRDARSSYFHGMGLSNTGQHLDAYLEFALALDGFRRFIEAYPEDPRVPETIYLLGVSFLNLREVLPSSAMGERFLMMCTDYFGDTVWGSQARLIWAPSRGQTAETKQVGGTNAF